MVKQRAPLSFRRPIRFLRAAAPFVLLAGGAWFYTQHGGWQDQPRTRVSQATTIPLPEAVPFRSVIDYDAFDRRISTLMAKKDMTGLAVAVVEDGKLAFRSEAHTPELQSLMRTPHAVCGLKNTSTNKTHI